MSLILKIFFPCIVFTDLFFLTSPSFSPGLAWLILIFALWLNLEITVLEALLMPHIRLKLFSMLTQFEVYFLSWKILYYICLCLPGDCCRIFMIQGPNILTIAISPGPAKLSGTCKYSQLCLK